MPGRTLSPLRRRSSSRAFLLALLTFATVACAGGDDAAVARTAARDSAGVRIVENRAPEWEGDSGWRIADEPSLTIGSVDGDQEYLLSRVASAVRLSDGRIVVADGGSSQLRFYDAEGRFLSASGGSGEGPGEFTFLNRVWRRPGDTLVATDLKPRTSHFDPAGRYLRAVPAAIPEGARILSIVGQADDGTYLAMSGTRGMGSNDAGRVIRDTLQLFRIAPDGSASTLLARQPGQERWGLHLGGVTNFPFLPFSAPASYAAGGRHFALGTGREPEVVLWNTDGTVATRVRWAAERRPVTSELVDRYREHNLAGETDPNERRRLEVFLAEAPVADSLPVYQSLLLGDDGHLWVQEYRPSWERDVSWQVFAPDGRWLGRVRTPPRFRLLQVGEEFVLGRWLDEDDVEYVRVYGLLK